MSSSDLLEPTSVLILNLLEHIGLLEEDPFYKALIKHERGLYAPGKLNPIIAFNSYYYKKSKLGQDAGRIRKYEDLWVDMEDIVNYDGEIVISKRELLKYKNIYKEEPFIPVVMINLVSALVTDYLLRSCKYTKGTINTTSYMKYIKPEYSYLVIKESFEERLENLLDEVDKFIGKDIWHIYFIANKGTSLVIEKTIDFRIYDWHCIKEKEKNY